MPQRMAGSTDDKLLTSDEAFYFVQDVLGMSSIKLKDNPQEFLKDLIRTYLHHIPFSNVQNMATPQHSRHVPTVSEIKRYIFTKIGGMCYQHNVAFYLLLKALGYDVSLIACDIQHPSDHAAIIVHSLTNEGSRHYVDVGNGTPLFSVVPFDFKDESPPYHHSFLRFKFSRQGDIIYCLHQVEGHPAKQTMEANRITDGWYRFITIHFKEGVAISHFEPSMTPIYVGCSDTPKSVFLTSVRCMAFPNGRFVCIKDTTFLIENETGKITKSYFRSLEEIKKAFARYFPQVSQEMLDVALNDEFITLDYKKGIL
ncbi:uncharacterized protein LOC129254935 [Lytechinus pictus]|uniref:uncharacterized protein LOC129254935 n=1 Tax=Lytechinus pictus TaxID=7653 RepID=UPI0030BA186C